MPTPDDIAALITESGNSFHCRVTQRFNDEGWSTLVSPYYMDAASNKPRELDLIAEKYWDCTDSYRQRHGAIVFRLFIECKYIAQPTVFWFSRKDVAAATDWLVAHTPLKKDNMYTAQHHYLAGAPTVAKLFASRPKASTENEAIYRALNQSLNAMVYLRGKRSIIPDIRTGRIPSLAVIEMPVIVCSSFASFYRVEMEDSAEPRAIDDHFQMEINYAYIDVHGKSTSEYFLLDVIDFDRLDTYLKAIESDKAAISALLY